MVQTKLTKLEKHIIDAYLTLKTIKEKLDYVNEMIHEKPVTKSRFYRMVRKISSNPTTQHYTNKGNYLIKHMELLKELEEIGNKIKNLPIKITKQNHKEYVKLDLEFFRITNVIEEFRHTPHKFL